MVTDETINYLGGHGTQAQQQLFQDAAARIHDLYEAAFPDAADDEAGMTDQQLAGAAMYALGDQTLEELASKVAHLSRRLEVARDELAGAMVTADIQGMTPTQIQRATGLARATVYKRLGRTGA